MASSSVFRIDLSAYVGVEEEVWYSKGVKYMLLDIRDIEHMTVYMSRDIQLLRNLEKEGLVIKKCASILDKSFRGI